MSNKDNEVKCVKEMEKLAEISGNIVSIIYSYISKPIKGMIRASELDLKLPDVVEVAKFKEDYGSFIGKKHRANRLIVEYRYPMHVSLELLIKAIMHEVCHNIVDYICFENTDVHEEYYKKFLEKHGYLNHPEELACEAFSEKVIESALNREEIYRLHGLYADIVSDMVSAHDNILMGDCEAAREYLEKIKPKLQELEEKMKSMTLLNTEILNKVYMASLDLAVYLAKKDYCRTLVVA